MGKHFINAREAIVTEALDGLIACSGGRLARLDGYPEIKVVLRADWDRPMWPSSPAAAPATSRRTPASSAPAC